MSDIQLAALEAARTIITEGVGEKEVAHGLCIVLADKEILADAKLVDKTHFQ